MYVTGCQFWHNRFSIWCSLKTKNRAWKVQGLLNSPNLLVFSGGEYLSWIADRYPANGNRASRWELCFDVDDPIDAYLSFRTDVSSIKDRRTSGKKDTIFHDTSRQIRMRSYKNSIAQLSGETGRSTNDSMFHNNAVGSNFYRAAFRYKRCSTED